MQDETRYGLLVLFGASLGAASVWLALAIGGIFHLKQMPWWADGLVALVMVGIALTAWFALWRYDSSRRSAETNG